MSLNLILTKSGWLVLSTTYLVLFIAPFADLDDLSEIDYTTQEISTFSYGGYSDSKKWIYKPINGKIILHRIEDYDSLGWLLARRQILNVDTITSYHNGREYLYE